MINLKKHKHKEKKLKKKENSDECLKPELVF